MICYKDKCYCQRSNKIYCQENNVELCNNILCYRHCWKIPKGVERICYADFSDFCTKFFHNLEPAECPFCGSYESRLTYRIKVKHISSLDGNIVDYIFRVSCKKCKSQVGEITLTYVKQDDKNTIKLGKLASIWKWNGYGKRQVDKEKRDKELEKVREERIQFEEVKRLLKGYGKH